MSKNELTQMDKDEIKSRVKGMSKIEMLESIKHYPDEVVANELIGRIKEYKKFTNNVVGCVLNAIKDGD
jgi:hypothetical protein